MSLVETIFTLYALLVGGAVGLPLARGRCVVLSAAVLRGLLAGFMALSLAEVLTRLLSRTRHNAVAAVAGGTAAGVVLALGAAMQRQIQGWLILNEHHDRARDLAIHTLSLLGYAYTVTGQDIELSHPAGLISVRPIGPKSVAVRFSSPYPSPRFTLFLSGYRKRLVFESGRRRVRPPRAAMS
jgi:hypothetical protein